MRNQTHGLMRFYRNDAMTAKIPNWPVVLLLAMCLMACLGPDSPDSDNQLLEIKKQLNEIRIAHEALQFNCSRVVEHLTQLEAEYENLKIKKDGLSNWSRQLAESFGPGIWYFSNDERPLPVQSLPDATPEILIEQLNRLLAQDGWPVVILKKIEGDTAFVGISDENQLTQHMGTTGATAFIEAVTYSLTSLKSIGYVDFLFAEGDHAIPGRYSR